MSQSSILTLHASAITHNSHAYIFTASTGSGKTTLITYLSESGYSYISDDEVKIDMTTQNVICTPSPLHLRVESIPVLLNYGINITVPITETKNFRRIVYLPKNTASGNIPIGGLFFIRRSETDNSCTLLNPDKAVQLIMQNLLSPDLDFSACLRFAIKLAPKCRHLTYSNMNYVSKIIENE